jgi:hypothetical protein
MENGVQSEQSPNKPVALCTKTHVLDTEMQIKECMQHLGGEAMNLKQAVP